MNPFFMWLRSHPAERLAIGIFVLVFLGVGWQVLAHRGPTPNAPSTPTPSTSSGAGAIPGDTALPTTPSTPSAADVSAASDVATKFLVALNMYRYDDGPYTLGQRAKPLITDRLYHAMGFDQPSDPTFGRHPELHQVDTVTVTRLTSEGFASNGDLGFLARYKIEQKTDQWTATVDGADELFLVQQSDGWRVDSFGPSSQATETP